MKRFNETLNITRFDELNVMKSAKSLYKKLNSDVREELLDLALLLYPLFWDEAEEIKKSREKADSDEEIETKSTEKAKAKSEINQKWVDRILSEYNHTTMYSYDNEVKRKQGYYMESILSAESSAERKKLSRKAISYWSRMCAEYADIVTNAAVLKAFRDSGAKKVKWVTQHDERVCTVCAPRNGRLYEIDKVPDIPHWGCRCYYIPFF